MREIIFRGQRKDNKEWVEGCYEYGYNQDKDFIHGIFVVDHTQKEVYWHEVIPETVGQYTGLKDKNGKMIFEGDVVTNGKGYKGRITWYTEHCAFMIYSITENKVYWLYDSDLSELETIGNIHSNPELLE